MKKSLTKNQIIRLKKDINKVFELGKSYSLSFLKYFISDNSLSYSRFIVIPVKHYGNSVERNYIRRQIKELWRINQDKIISGIDCVIIVYIHTNVSFNELENVFISLLKKSGIYEG